MNLEQLIAARPAERRHYGPWYCDLIEAAEREGLTMPALAERIGVVAATMYTWRRKRRERPEAEALRRATAGLVRVRLTDSKPVSRDDRPLELRLAGQRSLLIHRGFDREHLAALLSALERC